MTTKVFLYARVSSLGQCDGDGFTRQIEACQKYADEHGMEIVNIYKEMGVSGTKEERKALAEMMVSLEENGHNVKTVIVEKMDRLSRDLMIQEKLVADLRAGGFDLVSALEGADLLSDDPTRKFVRHILGAVSEWEKSMIVLKLRAARERKRVAQGKCEGQKGYAEHNPLAVDMIKKLRHEERFSFPQVAESMNSCGMRTQAGVPWTPANVARIARRLT